MTWLVVGGSLAFVGDAEDWFAGPGYVADSGHSRSLHRSPFVTVAMHRERGDGNILDMFAGLISNRTKNTKKILMQEILQFDSAQAELAARQTDEESCITASNALQMCVGSSEVRNIFFAQPTQWDAKKGKFVSVHIAMGPLLVSVS